MAQYSITTPSLIGFRPRGLDWAAWMAWRPVWIQMLGL